MAKIDLGLINSDGHGEPVPPKMDLHIIKFIIQERMKAINANPNLIKTKPWDHSDIFYAARTHFNQHNWNTSVYNDKTAGGADRRKDFYSKIKDVCENYYQIKRHQIGIYPEDRAVMAYGGKMFAVGFKNLSNLMYVGADVVCVEKQGTVLKMTPFTEGNGIAFIQSQGFVSEYGVALAQLTKGDWVTQEDYLGKQYNYQIKGNLGNLTDCDSSGIVIGMKIRGATRLGIDLDTIDEINQVNEGLEDELDIDLPIELEDLQEGTKANTHWDGLVGIINRSGDLYESLPNYEKIFYRNYLLSKPAILGGNIRFIDYLEDNRIELNTILAVIEPQAFWNWLRWKMLKVWPRRNYLRGGLMLTDDIRTPTFNKFITFYQKYIDTITKNRLEDERTEITNVEGMYDDFDGFKDSVPIIKKSIMGDVMNNVVLQDEKIQKIDLALEKIMQDGNGSSSKNPESGSEVDDEDEEEDDGNEWDE